MFPSVALYAQHCASEIFGDYIERMEERLSGSLLSEAPLWGFLSLSSRCIAQPGYKHFWGERPQVLEISEAKAPGELRKQTLQVPREGGGLNCSMGQNGSMLNACVSSRKDLLIDTYQLPNPHSQALPAASTPALQGSVGNKSARNQLGQWDLLCRGALVGTPEWRCGG